MKNTSTFESPSQLKWQERCGQQINLVNPFWARAEAWLRSAWIHFPTGHSQRVIWLSKEKQSTMKFFGVLLTVGFAAAQTAPQPAPQYDSPSSPAGTLGSYCSSLQGLTTLLSPNQTSNVAGFNVTVPPSISSSPTQLGALANVRMH